VDGLVKPNSITFATLLPTFVNLAALEQGKVIHESINRSEFRSNAFVDCTLVDMYVECGNIKGVCNVFDKIVKQDVVSCMGISKRLCNSLNISKTLVFCPHAAMHALWRRA
jgi:hypothetical protein